MMGIKVPTYQGVSGRCISKELGYIKFPSMLTINFSIYVVDIQLSI